MKTKKGRKKYAEQTAKIENLLKNFQGDFKDLTKDAYQVPTTIYILKYPGPLGGQGAPHFVFIGKILYDTAVINKQLLKAHKRPIVFAIRILDYSFMKPTEMVQVNRAKKSKAKALFMHYLKDKARLSPAVGVPKYYPIGVGFNPVKHKGDTTEQVEAAAKFCRYATPLLDGESMSIVFTKGGTLNHLHNYKLMVQSDDGTIGSIDPGTGHTDAQ